MRYGRRRFDSLTRWPCCRGLLSSPPADVDGASAFVWGVPPAPSSASEAEWPSAFDSIGDGFADVPSVGARYQPSGSDSCCSHFALRRTNSAAGDASAGEFRLQAGFCQTSAGLVIISFTSRVRTCTSYLYKVRAACRNLPRAVSLSCTAAPQHQNSSSLLSTRLPATTTSRPKWLQEWSEATAKVRKSRLSRAVCEPHLHRPLLKPNAPSLAGPRR